MELRYATTAQFVEAVVPVLPLPPKIRALSSADPRLQVGEHTWGLAETEVAAPSNEVWPQFFDHLQQADPACPVCHVPDLRLEFVEGFWRDAPLAPVIRDAEPQEFALLRSRHRAFCLVDLQPQLLGQEPAHRGHDPLAGAVAANVDVAVIRPRVRACARPEDRLHGKSGDPVGLAPCRVRRARDCSGGRERTALRRPLVHRADQAVFHHPGLEKRPDQLEHTFVGHARGNARHQAVMIDPVEKFFEIKVNHDTEARSNISLRLGHRLMGGASRSEAVTVLGKRRVPLLLENLQQGLLDQSVDDARYAEFSDPAVRLGDFDPLDRLRLVGSREQLRPNARPVLTQVVPGVVDGHPIDTRTALVPSNAFPRSYEILSVTHLLHQFSGVSRAFGCWLRHVGFGPLGAAERSFTPPRQFQGQYVLDLLPLSTHESPGLLSGDMKN